MAVLLKIVWLHLLY